MCMHYSRIWLFIPIYLPDAGTIPLVNFKESRFCI